MALILKDRVKETTTVTGTGPATLLGASTCFQAFTVVGNGNTTYYAIVGQNMSEWEVGLGTYTLSGTSLSRNTVLASSAGGTTKTNFSAGTKDVFCTYPAEKAVFGFTFSYSTYAARNDLRGLSPSANALMVVESLGLFQWVLGSTEPDDDETSFATASGVWELIAADTDMVFSESLASFDVLQGAVDDLTNVVTAFTGKFLTGTFSMTITSLAAITSTDFTVTVTGAAPGNKVVVVPGDAFGTSAADKGKLSYSAYVSSANTVTVSIRNASASSATLSATTWSVLVIKL